MGAMASVKAYAGPEFGWDYALRAAASGNCSLHYSLTVAAAAVWHETQTSVFTNASAPCATLVSSLFAPLRSSIRVSGRVAYLTESTESPVPVSDSTHMLFLSVFAAVRGAGSESAVATSLSKSFTTDMVGRLVNHLMMRSSRASVVSAFAVHQWDVATGSATDPDLDLSLWLRHESDWAIGGKKVLDVELKTGSRGPFKYSGEMAPDLFGVEFEAVGNGTATSVLALSFVPVRREASRPTVKGVTVTRTVERLTADGSYVEVETGSSLTIGTRLRVRLSAFADDYVEGLSITDRIPVAVEPIRETDSGVMPLFGRDMGGSYWWPRTEKTFGRADVTCSQAYARTFDCEYSAVVTFGASNFWWPAARGWSSSVPEVFGESIPLMDMSAE